MFCNAYKSIGTYCYRSKSPIADVVEARPFPRLTQFVARQRTIHLNRIMTIGTPLLNHHTSASPGRQLNHKLNWEKVIFAAANSRLPGETCAVFRIKWRRLASRFKTPPSFSPSSDRASAMPHLLLGCRVIIHPYEGLSPLDLNVQYCRICQQRDEGVKCHSLMKLLTVQISSSSAMSILDLLITAVDYSTTGIGAR